MASVQSLLLVCLLFGTAFCLEFNPPVCLEDVGCSDRDFKAEWEDIAISPDDYLPFDVYLIPHSHCDVGWKKTYTRYYEEEVRWILTNVTRALMNTTSSDPRLKRKFNWDVQAYFQRWWNDIPDWRQNEVRQLVEEGLFYFVGYGWVQSDESVADAYGRSMQLAEGHLALSRLFPSILNQTRVAWQIDPFGASSLSPSLFSMAGFDILVNTRIPRIQQDIFKGMHGLQFLWYGSPSGLDYPIWVHNMGDGGHPYCTPGNPPPPSGGNQGFKWEDGFQNNPPITAANVQQRADVFVQDLQVRYKWFKKGTPLLVPFGCDFLFQDAELEFYNMDYLVSYINEHNSTYLVNMTYATMDEWVDAIHSLDMEWPVYAGDFLPYNKQKEDIWSGIFTTRPDLKHRLRKTEWLVRTAEQLHAMVSLYLIAPAISTDPNSTLASAELERYLEDGAAVDYARQQVSIVHHHDSITGTSYHNNVYDYMRRLRDAKNSTSAVSSHSVSALLCSSTSSCDPEFFQYYDEESNNQTVLIIPDQSNTFMPFVVHNSLGRTRTEYVSLQLALSSAAPLSSSNLLLSTASTNSSLPFQLTQTSSPWYHLPYVYQLTFPATTPALGLSSYVLQYIPTDDFVAPDSPKFFSEPSTDEATYSLSNEYFKILINSTTGGIESITDLMSAEVEKQYPLAQQFFMYYSPRSDAYGFNPGEIHPLDVTFNISIVSGDLYDEAEVTVCPYLRYNVRLYKQPPNYPFALSDLDQALLGRGIDISFTVGPLDAYYEVIQRFHTEFNSNHTWYTDNGLSMDQHQLHKYNNKTDPRYTSSNYKSLRSTVFLLNTTQSDLPVGDFVEQLPDVDEFMVLTQQSGGSVSLEEGMLDIMLHRRTGSLVWQDMTQANVSCRLIIGKVADLEIERQLQDLQLQFPSSLLVGRVVQSWASIIDQWAAEFSPLVEDFPDPLHLFTFAAADFIGASSVEEPTLLPALKRRFLEQIASGGRSTSMEDFQPDKVALRWHNLLEYSTYSSSNSTLTVTSNELLDGCRFVTGEERGVSFLPLKERLQWTPDTSDVLPVLTPNIEYPLYSNSLMGTDPSDGSLVQLNPMNLRSYFQRFDCSAL